MFFFMLVLRLISRLPFPDAQLWFALPLALAFFYFGCWAVEWLGNNRDNPALAGVILPIGGVLVLTGSFLAFVPTWKLADPLQFSVDSDWPAFICVFFLVLVWLAMPHK